MTTPAILMLVVAILIVWGGLLASVLYLRAKPEVVDGPWAVDPDIDDSSAAGSRSRGEPPLERDL